MTDQNDDSREQGVEFGPLADELEDEEYPMDLETLLERYGDHELGLGDDTATLQTVLESQEMPPTSPPTTYTRASSGWSVTTTRSAGRTTRTAAAERKPRRTARRSRCRQLAARFENEICLIPSAA